jgi:hypothetical protein
LIGQLPNLSVFELDHTPYLADWILYLATRPLLRLSIIITGGYRLDEVQAVTQLPYTATSLSIRGSQNPLMDHLVFQAPLQRLELTSIPIEDLVDSHIECGSPVLPSLQALKLSRSRKEVVSLLKCTPNLVELKFEDDVDDGSNFPDLKGVVPKLESLEGSMKTLSYFADSRPIHSVDILDTLTDGPLHSFAKQLGSTVSIRTLSWTIGVDREGALDLEDHLDYIVTNCFHVQDLRIVFFVTPDEVSVSHLRKLNHIITSYRHKWPLVFKN